MYGYICPDCGRHLDPGEKCDCREERELEEKGNKVSKDAESRKSGQMKIKFDEVV